MSATSTSADDRIDAIADHLRDARTYDSGIEQAHRYGLERLVDDLSWLVTYLGRNLNVRVAKAAHPMAVALAELIDPNGHDANLRRTLLAGFEEAATEIAAKLTGQPDSYDDGPADGLHKCCGRTVKVSCEATTYDGQRIRYTRCRLCGQSDRIFDYPQAVAR